jgi:hypothetical protein
MYWFVQVRMNSALVPLRRTFQPYIGQVVILAGVTVFFLWVFLRIPEPGFLWSLIGIWFLYGISYVYFGMKYRVLWNKECVVMRASGGPERSILFDEITRVKNEVSNASDLQAQSRPFRRIAIYGRKHDSNARIDVSLRHFDLNDIDLLLTAIRAQRPDLEVPTVPLGKMKNRAGRDYKR